MIRNLNMVSVLQALYILLSETLKGGLNKIDESGATLVGGTLLMIRNLNMVSVLQALYILTGF